MENISIGKQITEHMPIFCAEGHNHGLVDHVEGNYIKITKDDNGKHHWLPLSAVSSVDEVVHLSWGHQQTKEQMLSEDPNS